MTDIAIGVLMPHSITGEHNEIIDIWILNNNYYYYQAELTEEGVEEGIYDNNNNLIDDNILNDDNPIYEQLENSTYGIESLSFTARP